MGYVYRHVRLDKNEVFYVGLSLLDDPQYKRAYSRGDRRNQHWKNITNTTLYRVDIIMDDLTVEETYEKEKEFIALYGRRDLGLGTLVNFTDGGEGMLGYVPSEETRKAARERQLGELSHNYGKPMPEETKLKILESRAWYKPTEETKKKMSESKVGELNPNFGKCMSEETIEKLRLINTGRKHSEDSKRKMSERQMGELNHNYGKFGELSPTFGRKHTDELKRHWSETRKGKNVGPSNHRYGKKASEETKLKQSLARKGKRTGAEDPKSQIVVDKYTGIFYVSIREAYHTMRFKFTEKHFQAMLRGDYPNKTSFEKI